MRYFSRSPEEWRKREKDFLNREKEKTRRSRRQGLYFLMLNVFVLFIFFVGLRLYYRQLPGQSFEINQLFIQLDDPYTSSKQLDIRVRLYNNHNKDRTVTIKNFNFQITKGEGILYSFLQQKPVQATLRAYTSRLLFDLTREIDITALESGQYKVIVSLQVDDQILKAEKTFTAVETYELIVDGLLDFYLPGETAALTAYIRNSTASVKNLNIEKVKYSLKRGNIVIMENEIVLNQQFNDVGIGKEVRILDIPNVKLTEVGNYILNIQCFVNNSISSVTLPVFCVSSAQSNLTNVKLYSDAPQEISGRDQVTFSIFVQNQSSKDVFLILDEITVRLEPSTLLFRNQSVRLWLAPYENYEIFRFYPWNSSIFNQTGFYKVVSQIKLKNETKSLETLIRVLQ